MCLHPQRKSWLCLEAIFLLESTFLWKPKIVACVLGVLPGFFFFFFGICATFYLSCFLYWKHFIVTCFSYLLFNTFLLVMYLRCHSLCFSPRSGRDDGRSSLHDSWARNFAWYQGNLFSTATLRKHLNGATAVISFMSGFGSNINAIRAASDQGVKRFVYISTADFGVVNYLLQGCNIGKRAAETELLTRFPFGGVILRPGLIYETRIAAVPLEMVLRVAKQSNHIPLVGPPLTPPDAVAKVAVTAATATDPVFPPGIIDANGIQRLLSE
ncbi:hypothetical protein AAZX31_06G055200 [Glycine max]